MRRSETEKTEDNIEFCEFVWKIDNFSVKRKQAQNGIELLIYSDPFYTHENGYKICLGAYPDGFGVDKGVHLTVAFYIMSGLSDNILQWPFNHDVTLSLVNQDTGRNQRNFVIKYNPYPNNARWKKPIKERNGGHGTSGLCLLDEILKNAALCKNDQIIIKFTMHK